MTSFFIYDESYGDVTEPQQLGCNVMLGACIPRCSVRVVLESVLRVQPARHIRPPLIDQSPVQVPCVRLHAEPRTSQQSLTDASQPLTPHLRVEMVCVVLGTSQQCR